MYLFQKSSTGAIREMKQERFFLEKDIQILVEANLSEIFNLQFVASELSVEKFRIDTLAFDEDSNSFVIIEYKKGNSYSVLDNSIAEETLYDSEVMRQCQIRSFKEHQI